LVNHNSDLLKLKAELAVQEGLVEAATSGVEESSDEFFKLTGFYPTEANTYDLKSAECFDGTTGEGLDTPYNEPFNYKSNNASWDFNLNDVTITRTPTGPSNKSLTQYFHV
jgi:hypothetical protein